jgi:naphthoate synthase
MTTHPDYTTILFREEGPIAILTLNRPDHGNMMTPTLCREMRDCLDLVRRETRTRVLVLTGAGDKFFCIGGEKEEFEDTTLYPGGMPTMEIYEAIERLQKPVIAAVNGFAVGGGNVMQVVCDLTIAKESAIFRQVGPMMGSFDAGFGTWYLEDLVGKKRAKEIWFCNDKMSAREAQAMGLINRVVPDATFWQDTMAWANHIALRGSYALAAVKGSFLARHQGVVGLSRVAHDLALPMYFSSEEAKELGLSFKERRAPDTSKFGH